MLLYWILKVITWLPIKILFPTFIQRKNLPKGEVIFVCNHRSVLDPVLISHTIINRPRIMAKKEVFQKKFNAFILKCFGAIPVDRKQIELSTFKQCLNVFKKNQQLVIFPEGTRNKNNDELQQLKSGASMLAIKGKVNIVPLYIIKKPKLFCFNKILVGEPINTQEFWDKKVTDNDLDLLNNKISEKINQLKNK